MNINPEILAPAGNEESLIAAVNCGADAVYLGAPKFSARAYAKNFSWEQLKNDIFYCHERNVKVHVALNTLLFGEKELREAADTAYELAKLGVDAFIIQDLALADIVKKIAPHIPRHASTQLSITDAAGAVFMRQLGFSRVVVGRETSEQELNEIIATNVETEVFVHGALCMSVSGQCYLSAAMGGRSGNRGRCAGACRLPFENNCLSLKDLSLIAHSCTLRDLGVRSFKIEGRMRRPEYVAAAVIALTKSLRTQAYDQQLLTSSFSRSGLTDGYFTTRLGREMFGIRGRDDVDAMSAALPLLKPLCTTPTSFQPIFMEVTVKKDIPMTLSASCSGVTYTAQGEIPQPAQTRDVTREDILSSLSKTGDTPYKLESLTAHLETGLFVSKSALNALRRTVLAGLSDLRCRRNTLVYPPDLTPLPHSRTDRSTDMIAMVETTEQFRALNPAHFALIGVPLSMAERLDSDEKLAVVLPRALFGADQQLKSRLNAIFDRGITTAVCATLGAVSTASELGFTVFGDFSLNATSARAVDQLYNLGVDHITVSPECDVLHLPHGVPDHLHVGYIGYGRIPLMVTRNCPAKQTTHYTGCHKEPCYIVDRKGTPFPVLCDERVSYVLNPNPIWLADRQLEYKKFDYVLLRFTTESGAQTAEIVTSFQAHKSPSFAYTRGLFSNIASWEKNEDKVKIKED